MADLSPQAIAAARKIAGLSDERMPKSVAIIMDGNGRWARAKNLPRSAGHVQGTTTVRTIVRESAQLGLSALTLYSFSIENWRRPKDEVNTLMHLYADTLQRERPTFMEYNVRLRHFGRRDGLPQSVLDQLDMTLEASSKNTGMFLCLALNYGARAEIIDAVQRIGSQIEAGTLKAKDVNDDLFSNSLDSAGVPDPDLLIRTAGEMRLSNFLLWQISYAELYVTETYWPDFNEPQFHKALQAYGARNRRFGGVDESNK